MDIKSVRQARLRLRNEIGPDRFAELERRADTYFNMYRRQLLKMHDAGLIGDDSLLKLNRLDFTPIQLLDEIDPDLVIETGKRARKELVVTSSGIKRLKEGFGGILETDSELLLDQFMLRTEARIFGNQANGNLYRLALNDPSNGFIHLKKPPREAGPMARLNYFLDGEEKNFWMPSQLATEWTGQNRILTHEWADKASTWLGVKLLRTMATGTNPVFAVANFPRELFGAWMKTDVYNGMWPVGAGQQVADLKAVAKDVWTPSYGPLTREFFEKGGGTQFLAQQGHIARYSENTRYNELMRKEPVRQFLFWAEYVSERMELWNRLAVYRRSKLAGNTSEESARIAREIIDFDQGGVLTKTLDPLIPYVNAATQGVRSMGAAALKDPVLFSAKLLQAQANVGFLNMFNRQVNQEGWQQIPDDMKHSHLIIMTNQHYIDEQGQKRYMYYRIPTEQTLRPFVGLTNYMMDRYFDGKLPDETVLKSLLPAFRDAVDVLGFGRGVPLPPLLDAYLTYYTNRDTWNQMPVWTGPEVPPESEISMRPGRVTGQVFQDLGAATGLSPARMEAASSSLFPRHPITDITSQIYKVARPQELPPSLEKNQIQRLREISLFGRSIGFTNPNSRFRGTYEQYLKEGNAERMEAARKVDFFIDERKAQGSTDPFDDAFDLIDTMAESKMWIDGGEWARRRVKARRRIEDFFEDNGGREEVLNLPGMPGYLWWLNVRDIRTPEMKAEMVGEIWVASPPETRKMISRLVEELPGLRSPDFVQAWENELAILQGRRTREPRSP